MHFRYQMRDSPSHWLDINSETGVISTRASLHNDDMENHTFLAIVIAVDDGKGLKVSLHHNNTLIHAKIHVGAKLCVRRVNSCPPETQEDPPYCLTCFIHENTDLRT